MADKEKFFLMEKQAAVVSLDCPVMCCVVSHHIHKAAPNVLRKNVEVGKHIALPSSCFHARADDLAVGCPSSLVHSGWER